MDTLLLGLTVVSLIVALVMSVTAWRLMCDEKRRSAARIAALSAAASDDMLRNDFPELPVVEQPVQRAAARTPWKPAPFDSTSHAPVAADEVSLRVGATDTRASTLLHGSGFLGAAEVERGSGNRQRGLAIATVVFFITITGGFLYMMSGSDSATAVATAPNETPLELVSLSHARQNNKLAVSGLVRNPVAGKPVEKLSAVVFLFDRAGTFVTSSRAHVDFLKLGAGDESPFVVSIDAPASVSRYRVSFRTDDGVVPHIDRRGESPAAVAGEQPVSVTLK
jgi:heme exporter protein D